MKVVFDGMASGEYGNVMRAKALVKTELGPYRYDLASGRVDIKAFKRDVTRSRLVIIGTELQEDKIRKRFSGLFA